jgi:hypothetical protein
MSNENGDPHDGLQQALQPSAQLERKPWNPTRQCNAHNRQGERCRRQPIPGGTVCALHGGKIPAVQRVARERLLAMVEPALDALLRALRTEPACVVCGRSDADRDPVVIRAAQLVLDRTGFAPALTVRHVQAEDPYADFTLDETIEKLDELRAEAVALRDEINARGIDAESIDAVIVNDEQSLTIKDCSDDTEQPLDNEHDDD